MPNPNGKKLTPAEHAEKAHRAYELSLQRWSNREIARELDVSTTTVTMLLKEERLTRRKERPDPTEDALAQYDAIIRHGWEVLKQIFNPSSYTVPAVLNAIANAQKEKDRIAGVRAPVEWKGVLEKQIDFSEFSEEEIKTFEALLDRVYVPNEN